MKKVSVRELAFMSLCVVLSLFAKNIVSPVTNVLTDFINIPGGSATVGFTLAFLIIGKLIVNVPWAASAMAFVQALLSLALGFSGRQGALALVSYTVPGLIIDGMAFLLRKQDAVYCIAACAAGSAASALLSSWFAMHLTGVPLLLWMIMAAVSGTAGGALAYLIAGRLKKILGQKLPESR